MRKLRKELGMSKENLKEADVQNINPVVKIVYFRNSLGDLVPQNTTRSQIINRNKNYYRKTKKARSNNEQ